MKIEQVKALKRVKSSDVMSLYEAIVAFLVDDFEYTITRMEQKPTIESLLLETYDDTKKLAILAIANTQLAEFFEIACQNVWNKEKGGI